MHRFDDSMRLGTWNVEYAAVRAKNDRRLARLRDMDADIWVLTETHDDLDLGRDYEAVSTIQRPAQRTGARWTTIWSRFRVARLLAVEDANRTVAALVESPMGPLVVFRTVLPWQSDRGPDGTAKGWTEHHRVVPMQGRGMGAAATRPSRRGAVRRG